MNNFVTAFIADDASGNVMTCSSPDGVQWTNSTQVGQLSSGTPGLALFNFSLWVAFVADNATNDLLTCSSADGVHWTRQSLVGQTSKFSPTLIVFSRSLWLVFVANDDSNKILICSSPDGQHWTAATPVGQTTNAPPSLTVFNNKLWMAFIANNDSRQILVCSSADGRNWTVGTLVAQLSKTAPSLTLFDNKLWLSFVANNASDDIMICSSADGVHWSTSTQVGQLSHFAPSITALNGKLWMAFVADNATNNVLTCSSTDGLNWSTGTLMNQSSKSAPVLTTAVSLTGTVRPLYHLLTVIYAPPGTNGGNSQSSVDYGSSSSAGTTTSTGNSFKAGGALEVTTGLPVIGVNEDFTASSMSTNNSAVEIKKNQDNDIKVRAPNTDGINHDEDMFCLWLNPLLNLTFDPSGNIQWTMGVDGAFMITQYVLAGELKNPATMRIAVKQTLDQYGLTESDYAEILATNPFATTPAPLDPDRFVEETILTYEPPQHPTDPIAVQSYTLTNSVMSTTAHSTQVDLAVSVKVSGGITGLLKLGATGSFQWTYTSSSGSTNLSSQSANATIAAPSFGYAGPTNVIVYWDTVFNTFMFELTAVPSNSRGQIRVLDSTGNPLVFQPVTLN
jgi:hypothetical protein